MKDSIPPSPIDTGSERAGLFQAPDKAALLGHPEDAQTERSPHRGGPWRIRRPKLIQACLGTAA